MEAPDRAVVDDRNLVRGDFSVGEAGKKLYYCRFSENLGRPGSPLLILILHGRNGAGNDNTQQLSAPAVRPFLEYVRAHRIKAVLLIPQCPPGRSWVDDDMMKLVMAFFEAKAKEYRVPPENRLLTGFSGGGEGCCFLAAEHPGRFARVLLVGSVGSPDAVRKMRGDFYIAIGAEDRAVPPSNAERMARTLLDNGSRVRLEIISGTGHVDGGRAAYRGVARRWFFGHFGR